MNGEMKNFFKNNEVRIGRGKDFDTNPPIYYSSLSNAFFHYFQTFRVKKNSYHFYTDVDSWTRKSLGFNFFNVNDDSFFTVLNFHRFFELFIKDLLRRINPYLAVKFPQKENEVFSYLGGELPAEQINTIEFGEAKRRFSKAFEYYKRDSETYINILMKFEFIKEQFNQETLEILSEWRNRLMHNGLTNLNLFALDYLISQRVIPLVKEILEAEKDKLNGVIFHFRKTKTGIDIFEELLKVKFNNNSKAKNLLLPLQQLGHLKEIGRASYNLDIAMRNKKSYYEPCDDNPIRRIKRLAEQEKDDPHYYDLKRCICCGEVTMVSYRKEIESPFKENKYEVIRWIRCYNCSYSLRNNIGEPKNFGLTDEYIFAPT